MEQQSKEARERLKMATRAEFEYLVFEAMLTPQNVFLVQRL